MTTPIGPSPQRSEFLERLLTRADAYPVAGDWRAEAFAVIAPNIRAMPAIAPVAAAAALPLRAIAEAARAVADADHGAAEAELGVARARWVFLATPVHYLAEMSNVRLAGDGILSLGLSAAAALAEDFNRVWNDAGLKLMVGITDELFVVCDRGLATETKDPGQALDEHIDAYLPSGAGSSQLRRLMSEMEMWLFDHPVNRERSRQSLPSVSALWIWGGGAALTSVPTVQGWTAGADPFFKSFGARPEFPRAAGAGVVVLNEMPGSEAWHQMESRWLSPALAELRAGLVDQLVLSMGGRRFRVRSAGLRRFWRRARPWWESFA